MKTFLPISLVCSFHAILLAGLARAQEFDYFLFETNQIPTDVGASDFYGIESAAWGDYAVSSTFLQDTDGTSNAGAAYVYRKNETSLEMYEYQKIQAPTLTAEARFGFKISMCRQYIIVLESGTSTIYFYELDGSEQWVVFDTTTLGNAKSVACAGEYFAVGDRNLRSILSQSRSVYSARRLRHRINFRRSI